jgi:predicted metal-dependent hydrolase
LKEIHKQRLQQELIKYSKQIGISDKDIPTLLFSPNEYIRRVEEYYNGKATGKTIKKVKSKGLGRCHDEAKLILLNQNSRGYTWEYDRNQNGEKIKTRMLGEVYYRKRKIKVNYNLYKKVLIHELVHYRFPNMQHGDRFEKRIGEILHGEVFPYTNTQSTSTNIDNNEVKKLCLNLVNGIQTSQS